MSRHLNFVLGFQLGVPFCNNVGHKLSFSLPRFSLEIIPSGSLTTFTVSTFIPCGDLKTVFFSRSYQNFTSWCPNLTWDWVSALEFWNGSQRAFWDQQQCSEPATGPVQVRVMEKVEKQNRDGEEWGSSWAGHWEKREVDLGQDQCPDVLTYTVDINPRRPMEAVETFPRASKQKFTHPRKLFWLLPPPTDTVLTLLAWLHQQEKGIWVGVGC